MKYFVSFFSFPFLLVHHVTASPYCLRSNTQALVGSIQRAKSIPQVWKSFGYLELKNTYLTQPFYTGLYETFDLFIKELKRHPDLELQLSKTEKNFRTSADGKFFCSVPLGAKDRTQCGDKDNKYYFQFTQKYAHLLRKTHPKLFSQHPILNIFFNQLQTVHQACEKIFDQILSNLRKQGAVLDTMLGKEGKRAIVLKLLAYYGKDNSGTSPHYDKSGLSLILDNDDEGPGSFLVCPYQDQFDASKLTPVTRLYEKNTRQSSAVLIPGVLLKHRGSDIMPTPHAVRSFHKNVRHAVIAFALTPDTDMSTISSQIIHKHLVPELQKPV